MSRFVIFIGILLILIMQGLEGENLEDLEEIAHSMGNISEVYHQMKLNTVWRSKGFAGTFCYEITNIDDIMINRDELPNMYENYLTDADEYNFKVNLMRGMFNSRIKRYSFLDLYLFSAYYAHKSELVNYVESGGEVQEITKNFGRYYHHLLMGPIFDFKKLPLRLTLAPYINFIHNFEKNTTDVKYEKTIYDLTVNMYTSENYYLDLFLRAFLDNEGLSNLDNSNENRQNEYNLGITYNLTNLLSCDLTYYQDYRRRNYFKGELNFLEDIKGSITLKENFEVYESTWKVLIPYIWNPDEGVFVTFTYDGSYINDSEAGGESWGSGFTFCLRLHPGISTDFFDNYLMALWGGWRNNNNEDLKKTALVKNKNIVTLTAGIRRKQFTLLEWLLNR